MKPNYLFLCAPNITLLCFAQNVFLSCVVFWANLAEYIHGMKLYAVFWCFLVCSFSVRVISCVFMGAEFRPQDEDISVRHGGDRAP